MEVDCGRTYVCSGGGGEGGRRCPCSPSQPSLVRLHVEACPCGWGQGRQALPEPLAGSGPGALWRGQGPARQLRRAAPALTAGGDHRAARHGASAGWGRRSEAGGRAGERKASERQLRGQLDLQHPQLAPVPPSPTQKAPCPPATHSNVFSALPRPAGGWASRRMQRVQKSALLVTSVQNANWFELCAQRSVIECPEQPDGGRC